MPLNSFLYPNANVAPYTLGAGGFGQPGQPLSLPSWEPAQSPLAPGAMSLMNPAIPGLGAQDAARFSFLNQQAAPGTFLPYLNAGIQGAGMLGNLYLGWRSLEEARKASAFQQGMAQKNYDNSVKSYNNAVDGRVRGNLSTDTIQRDPVAVQAEIDRRKIGGSP